MEKQVAIVVGGGQTLGEFLSKGLAEAGYDVLTADINGENAEKVKALIFKLIDKLEV